MLFENIMKAKEPGNLEFKFLNVDNSYDAYYKFKVNKLRSN